MVSTGCGLGSIRFYNIDVQMEQKKAPEIQMLFFFTAVQGFEPRHTESESAVLPLHNTAISLMSFASVDAHCPLLTDVIISLRDRFVKCFSKKNSDNLFFPFLSASYSYIIDFYGCSCYNSVVFSDESCLPFCRAPASGNACSSVRGSGEIRIRGKFGENPSQPPLP